MSGETQITVIGNLVEAPEIRFTQSGAAVANFTIASTPRTFDKASGDWKDGEALFMRCSLWRDAAEHTADSLTKGMRVIATGNLRQRSYETKQGERRTVVELDVDEIGPSLKYATATVTKAQRNGGNGQNSGGNGGQNSNSRPAQNTNSGWGGQDTGGWGSAEDAPF